MTNKNCTTPIAITDLVKKLGYDDSDKLANWAGGIIRQKEDFNEYLCNDGSAGRADARPEKTLVTSEAQVLIDNMCLLKPYARLFGKSNEGKSEYPPLRALSKSSRDPTLEGKIKKLQQKLNTNIARSQQAKDALPRFAALFLSDRPVNIKTESIRALLSDINGWQDVAPSYQNGLWNDIVLLLDKLQTTNPSSELHYELGEKLFLMGEADEAIEHLDKAIEIQPDYGYSHVALAVIYLSKIRQLARDTSNQLAMTDFSGPFEHPVDSIEHNINEQLDSSYSSYRTFHADFIKHAVLGLMYWPGQIIAKGKSSLGLHSIRDHGDSELDYTCTELLQALLLHINESDFELWEDEISMIVRLHFSRHGLGESWSMPFGVSDSLRGQMLKIVSWVSSDGLKQILDEQTTPKQVFSMLRYSDYSYFQSTDFQCYYIKVYGQEAYQDLSLMTLKGHQFESLINNAEQLASPMHKAIKASILESSGQNVPVSVEALFDYENDETDCVYSHHETASKISEQIKGWKKLLEHPAWLEFGSTTCAPQTCCKVILMGLLTELSLNIEPKCNLATLLRFVEVKSNVDAAVDDYEQALFNYFKKCIESSCEYGHHPATAMALEKIMMSRHEIENFDCREV